MKREYDGDIAEAKPWVEFATNRVSESRCLSCGSTELLDQATADGIFVPSHGHFQIRWIGLCSREYLDWFYTPEGLRIADG
ncbi:MAG: hypothetical protein KDA91_14265 [Planctomycetaceae bacterium]|nr:hypothetical protein [Planctomycetaceae bacterium]